MLESKENERETGMSMGRKREYPSLKPGTDTSSISRREGGWGNKWEVRDMALDKVVQERGR